MKRLLLFFLFATLLIAQRPSLGQTTVNFAYTGAAQTFTVPAGVTSLSVVANGAQGGTYNATYSPGGPGGRVSATLTVLPDAILYIYVGGAGGDPVGVPSGGYLEGGGGYNGGGAGGGYYYAGGSPYYNGGGGGGGGTDIRSESGSLSSRLLVAGGGGGKGSGAIGGVGGGLTGGPGGNSSAGDGYIGGGGGTSSSGGLGNTNAAGMTGTIGQGGSGPYYGGGGGGGYYGGGGGGNGSGGGGGSSYTDPMLASGVVHTQGVNTGNGSLQIIYTLNQPPANTPPTVANTISPQSATVNQAFSYVIPANTFTDAETPNGLTLSVSGLPSGLNFMAPATISGTPSVSGVSTVTVTATDPGSLSVSTSFNLTVNAAPASVPQTITISNSTPNQICGSKGTSVVVNFTTTGTYSDPFYVALVKTQKTSGYAPTTTTIKQVSTTTGSATLVLPSYLASSYYTSNQEYLRYKLVVGNGSVTSADYAVSVLLPAAGSITVQAPASVTSPGQSVHLSTPAAAGVSKTWYSHAETEYWQDGTLLSGQTADEIDVTPSTSTYYSVVYTDNSTSCSNRSNRVRVPFTITIAGTSADGVYNEGRGVQLDGSGMVSGTGQPAPQYYVPSGADTDAQVYSTLFDLGFSASWSAYFIIRKSNIWEIYSGGHTTYAPVSYTRIYHTKDLFPTVSSGGRIATPGGRQVATVRGTRPPENAVWIKDADNSEQLLTLTGVSEENAAMPVSLTYFRATLTANKQVTLSWQTSFEHNADYFSVERSTDLLTFQSIARVQASGNATSLKDYALTDETPLRGLSYYRLNQVDLDGTSHTYPAVSIRTEGTDALYPNPSNETFVNLDVAPTSTISLSTLQGESLPFDRKKVSESSVQLLPKIALTPGIYLVTVNGITRKWVVQ